MRSEERERGTRNEELPMRIRMRNFTSLVVQRQLDFIFIAAEEEERIRTKLKTNALLIEDFRKWLEWLQFNDMLVSLRSG